MRHFSAVALVYDMTWHMCECFHWILGLMYCVVPCGMFRRPVLILGLLWQIIKIQLTSQISLKNYPELVLLLREGEEMAALSALPPEDILLRWFNYHLEKGGSARRVTNFGDDLKVSVCGVCVSRHWIRGSTLYMIDMLNGNTYFTLQCSSHFLIWNPMQTQDSECYSVLLHQLDSAQCDLCTETDPLEKAGHVISNAVRLGAYPFIRAEDICAANKKLNLGFVALLFNTCHGLTVCMLRPVCVYG